MYASMRRSFCLFLTVVLLMVATPAFAANSWQTISLPSRALNITSHSDVFSVCGTDELIASSTDAGKTWQIKHRQTDGEVLTHIGFINGKIGYAAGSNGLLLWTQDGGDTWKPTPSDSELPIRVSFADGLHGLRSTRSGVAMTADGGATWQRITAMKSIKDLEKFTYVGGLAALDANHCMILLMQGALSAWRFFATADAGKTWTVAEIPSIGLRSLVVRNGEYWAFGHEVIEKDKPGGGYGVALALHSADGKHWEHGVRSPKEYIECNAQGCLLWDGAIVDVFHNKPIFIIVPTAGALTNKWAAGGGNVCSVGDDLKCASATQSETLPARPTDNVQGWLRSWSSPEPEEPGCIRCSYPRFLAGANDAGSLPDPRRMALANVNVYFRIRKNGTVSDVSVTRAPTPEVESTVEEIAKHWLFEPVLRDGVHVEQQREIRLQLIVPRPRP